MKFDASQDSALAEMGEMAQALREMAQAVRFDVSVTDDSIRMNMGGLGNTFPFRQDGDTAYITRKGVEDANFLEYIDGEWHMTEDTTTMILTPKK